MTTTKENNRTNTNCTDEYYYSTPTFRPYFLKKLDENIENSDRNLIFTLLFIIFAIIGMATVFSWVVRLITWVVSSFF